MILEQSIAIKAMMATNLVFQTNFPASQGFWDWLPVPGAALTSNTVFQENIGSLRQEIDLYRLNIPSFTVESVRQASCMDQEEFRLVLTNDWILSFDYGRLTGFTSPVLARPERGSVKLTNAILSEAKAIELAKVCARKTGLTDRDLYLYLEPKVGSVPRLPWFPFYEFEWKVPNEWDTCTCNITVDVRDGTVVKAFFPHLFGKLVRAKTTTNAPPQDEENWWSAPPDSAVEQRLGETICEELIRWSPDGDYPTNWITVEALRHQVKWRFSNQAEPERFWSASVSYTNESGVSWSFGLINGHLKSWDSSSNFFSARYPDVENYTGVWRLSEKHAVELVRKQVRKMGLTPRQIKFLRNKPNLMQPRLVGDRYIVPRLQIRWSAGSGWIPNEDVEAEVDADAGKIKRLSLGTRE